MSRCIDLERDEQVLLPDGKWHRVKGKSFTVDAYEFVDQDQPVDQGRPGRRRLPSTGATWQDANGTLVACPLTAILAVRLRRAGRKLASAATTPAKLWGGPKQEDE